MIWKVGKVGLGITLFVAVFIGSVILRDYLYESFLQSNKGRIKVGMSEADVISILGNPTMKAMSDEPGLYWCYGSDSWMERENSYCGNVGFHVSGGRVTEEP